MFKTVDEKQHNVVLYNKASGETFVLDYPEGASLMYIYGQRISTHFNFLPLNYSYVSVGNDLRFIANGHKWANDNLSIKEKKEGLDMLNRHSHSKTDFEWSDLNESMLLGGGYVHLYFKILECLDAMKNGSNIYWPFPEAQLHPRVCCELPNLFLDILSKGKATKPLVITSNSEHIMLRTMKLIREKNLDHKKVIIMNMDIK